MIAATLDRICVVMMSAVGDAVHVLPVINAIKRAHPASHITWVLQPGPATLVRGHRSVDEIVLFDRTRGWRAFTDIRAQLAARRFDLVIDLQVYFKAGIVTSFTRAPVKLGFDRARARDMNWLFTNRTHPPARRPARAGSVFRVPHGARHRRTSPWRGTWVPGPPSAHGSASSSRPCERPAAAIVVATSKPRQGLGAGTLGRGGRRPPP